MSDVTPYHVPKEPGRWRAIMLAALVHLALLVFLWIGVRWQNDTPVTIEAEVWSPQPREAAPPPRPAPEPEPTKQPEPAPPVKETPKPAVTEPPVEKPDIALEQEKKRKALEQKKREEAERQAKQKQKEEEEREAKLKREKEETAKRKKQEAEEQAKKDKAEKEKRVAEAKRKQDDEAYEKQMAKMREENLKHMTAGLGGTGDAPKAQGGRRDPGYGDRIGAKIKSNTIFNVPENLSGNPAVEYAVELLPDGSLRGTPRKLKSSGMPGFDEAVLRAIEKSQPFPRDKSGSVPSTLTVSQKPKDQ